jgi:hypothetical protein
MDEIPLPRIRQPSDESLHEIAVRVEECSALARPNVLADERFEKGRFSGPSSSQDVEVRTPVGLSDTEHPPIVPEIETAEEGDAFVNVRRHVLIVTIPREG